MSEPTLGRVTASVLALSTFLSGVELAGAAAQPRQVTPEMGKLERNEQRARLQAQCPAPPPRVPESEEARYPIHVDEWGGSGPPVLLIHGGVQGRIGGGPRTFDRQRSLTTMGWSVERVSRPGFGDSPTRGPDDMDADSRALAELIKSGANVIGHSWGGTEALLAVARRPKRVRSLILIEPAIAPTIGGPAALAAPGVAEVLKKRTVAELSARTPADFARIFASQMGEMAHDMQLGPGPAINDQDATTFGCTLLAARMAPTEEVLAAIETVKKAHIPVLIVTGGWNPSFDATADVLARLLDGRRVIVRSPNHFVQYSNAAEFNTVASDFMRAADKAARP